MSHTALIERKNEFASQEANKAFMGEAARRLVEGCDLDSKSMKKFMYLLQYGRNRLGQPLYLLPQLSRPRRTTSYRKAIKAWADVERRREQTEEGC